jgi:hypothetical protein
VRYHGTLCDLSEVAAPEWLPLAGCRNYLGISCMSADHRATGRPWATAVALASHTSRGSSSLRHRCAVCTAGLGNGHALRLVRLAARQLTAVAQPLQGPLASARSTGPLRVRSITTGVSHLYRSFIGAPSACAYRHFCEMLAAATTDPRRAALVRVPLLANSDPKARSALCIRI